MLERMLAATVKFATQINSGMAPYWLTLTGSSGVGKTHLLKATMKAFMETIRFDFGLDAAKQRLIGQRGQYVDWRKLCSTVREGSWGWVDDICEDDFVAIDDFGAEFSKGGFTESVLDRILNARVRKWTMLTCNLPLSEISERMDARIASRLIRGNNVVVECDTIDYALRAQEEPSI